MSESRKLLSLDEISKIYGIPLWTLYKYSSLRKIPVTKIGSRVYVRVQDFDKYLEEKTVKEVRNG